MRHNHVVIMAGGVGSRFWPLSTPEFPKQFIDVLGCGKSLIQLTFDRYSGICLPENFWVVTNEAYVDIVKQQLPDIPASHILPEPAARNTAPCISWACWSIARVDAEANIVVTPADAVVMNTMEFCRITQNALEHTRKHIGRILTIGIKPTRPETGYGYIETGGHVCGDICHVNSFKEKPDKELALQYFHQGTYLWNAGIFVWHIQTVVEAIRKYKPTLASDIDEMLSTGNIKGKFPLCEKISIDYALLEPASQDGIVYTLPADIGWSDLGNWASLHDKLSKDLHDNGAVGNVAFFDCSDCIVHVKDATKVVLQGLNSYIVSEKDGQILVCKREEEQRIKEFINC